MRVSFGFICESANHIAIKRDLFYTDDVNTQGLRDFFSK